ncbi:MAG: YigZ family protein [Candidatus Cloacimonetes bacterium]|nr:YigZ family protein [Candidatus Cloacimonadota bacterium]
MNYFYSVEKDRKVETKNRRSIFIAHLHYAETMKEAKEFISQVSAEHKTANHNCWAYIVGEKGETFHSSDAGEPSGTAGKPILNTLKKRKMTNIVAVVTRYFGGVKLGIRGLIEAYGESVETAIEQSPLKKLLNLIVFHLSTSYDFAEKLKYNIKSFNAEISDIKYSEKVEFHIKIEEYKKKELEKYLIELEKAGKIEILATNLSS